MPEEGSDQVQRWMRLGGVATSRLTLVEIASALHRRARAHQILRSDLGRALSALDADIDEFHVVELSPETEERARIVLKSHGLRASDAIQLASCLHVFRRFGGGVTFVAWDASLLRAARALGLPTAGGPA